MKISVITRHAISNYGSILQTYAMQKVLQDMGHEVEIVDYIRNDEDYYEITKVLIRKSEKWNKNFLTRAVYHAIQSPEYFIMGKKFKKFRRQYLNLSARYNSLEELTEKKPVADLYCTGSDQVWGPIGDELYDPAYFLAYTDSDDFRFSYAGSFGKTALNEEAKMAYKYYLNRYYKIAVREKSAIEIISSMGISGAEQVLDPTLLLSSKEWSMLIKNEINKDYVLIYQLHSNSQMDSYAKEFAKKTGLPLIRITLAMHQIARGGKLVLLPELGTFLSYIKNAKYMITDSFHGTIFSIIFGTQFIDVLPGETQTRNQSILELMGLTDRMLTDYSDFSFIDKKINYLRCNKILDDNKKSSVEYLKSTISEYDNGAIR
jgi:hypothetical protein